MRDATLLSDRPALVRLAGLVVTAFLAGIAFHAVTAGGSEPRSSVDGATGGNGATVPSPGGPGPSRTEEGAPAGFSHDQGGALAASASFVCSGQALLDVDPLAAEEAIRQMATMSSADRQVEEMLARLSALRDRLSTGSGPTELRQSAVAWRVDAIDPNTARVAIWSVSVLSRAGVAPPQASWAISSLDLVWERGDWHLDRETVQPGPAPVLDNSTAPATAAQLVSVLDGFTDFGSTT